MTTYEHPTDGAYAETRATLDDGRVVTVNTQYAVVLPHGQHADTCAQLNRIGGRCDCGLLAGLDLAAIIADARANGKFGPEPTPAAPALAEAVRPRGVCPRCGSYCCGDCQS